MDNNDLVIVSATLIIANILRSRKKNKKRKMWVKSWLLRLDEKSAYQNILQELHLEDAEHFSRYLRMNCETFEVSIKTILFYS